MPTVWGVVATRPAAGVGRIVSRSNLAIYSLLYASSDWKISVYFVTSRKRGKQESPLFFDDDSDSIFDDENFQKLLSTTKANTKCGVSFTISLWLWIKRVWIQCLGQNSCLFNIVTVEDWAKFWAHEKSSESSPKNKTPPPRHPQFPYPDTHSSPENLGQK